MLNPITCETQPFMTEWMLDEIDRMEQSGSRRSEGLEDDEDDEVDWLFRRYLEG